MKPDVDGFEQGFNGIPSRKDRSKMSPERLAIILSDLISKNDKDTPAYILVEYELKLRIAAIQARATFRSTLLNILGGILCVCLGYVLATLPSKYSPKQECKCTCEMQNQQKMPLPKPTPPSILKR